MFVSLAYIVDAIEARGGKGKENAKAEMIRSRAIVRLRTYLHQVRVWSADPQIKC